MARFDAFCAFIHKIRHILQLCVLTLLLVCLFGWVYLNDVRSASEEIIETRINENYTTVTEPIADGNELRQPIRTSLPVYGASFIFTIYNENCYGTVTVELQDAAGNVLASGAKPTTELLDNTYQAIVFDKAVIPDGETDYTLVIRYNAAEGGGRLGLWVSESAEAGYEEITLNGEKLDATLGYSLVTNRVGSGIKTAYLALAAFALIAALLGYYLLFIRKVSVTKAFVYFALVLGFVYVLAMPPYIAPDEEVHIHSAYELSNTMLGVENADRLVMRASDSGTLPHSDKVSAFCYQTYAQELFGKCTDSSLVNTEYITADVFFVQYLPQALAMTIGRLLGFNYITLIFLGRCANLLTYTALMAAAIALMPSFKRVVACIGLLPMCLHLAASYNYDAMLIGVSSVFFALVLKYTLQEEKLRWRDLALLCAVIVLMAPMKMLYVLLVPFCFIIPVKKCPGRVRYLLIGLAALAVVFAVIFAPYILRYAGISAESLQAASEKTVEAVNPLNVDYVERDFWTLSYILTHLTGAAKLLAATVQENTFMYLVQLVGGELGEPILNDLYAWMPGVVGLMMLLPLSAVRHTDEEPVLNTPRRAWTALVLLALCGALLIVLYGWTPLRNTTLWGMQGRYLLPCLVPALLVLQPRHITMDKDYTQAILGTECLLSLITIVSVFQCICGQAVK